ncbi:hypothetical protein JVT61DRAFT_10719 [Boletus reticuloceps]|uniref:CxC1-like cysteine cluster associated with KDZ transposases domain-containing protein n=1 Tax=Boletus reticuloceps TaxID=495285 RepID=A0A8I3A579_9AGAM|nr:hypothetical protein JVT61DRAFT_10719 [Boletus reticuloceps]
MQEMTERRMVALEALPAEDQAAVDRMYADQGVAVCYDEPMPFGSAESDKEDDDDRYNMEDEFTDLTKHMSSWHHPDTRNHRDRTAIQHDQWDIQMTYLVDAYLDYRSRDSGDGFPTSVQSAVSPEADEEPPEHPPGTIVNIELVDMFTRRRATLVTRQGHLYPNENLLYHGYIGCSPVYPAIAISLRTLAAFRQAHRSLSPIPLYAISLAYDAYLEILNQVDKHISRALSHNSQEWRLRNECPACFYQLEDEPNLMFDWLVSIDSNNNSLKRWDTTAYGMTPRDDHRQPRSTYWLTDKEVDKFKYEVAARKTGASDNQHDDDWETDPDATSEIFNCVDRSRNARSDQHKKTLSVFQETGIFVVSCRHRFVLLACDMIKSGEL